MFSCSLHQSSSFLLLGRFACLSGLRRGRWHFTKLSCSSRLSLTSICSFSATTSSSSGTGVRGGGRRSAIKQRTPHSPTITNSITNSNVDFKTKGVRTNKHQTVFQLQQELQRLQQNTIANPPTTTTTTNSTNNTTTTTTPTSTPSSSLSSPSQPTRAGGFMGVVAEGMAHGVGWAFGQRAVDALMGPRQMEVVHHNDDQQQGGVDGSGSSSANDGTEGAGYTDASSSAGDGGVVGGWGETGSQQDVQEGDEGGGGFFGNMFGGDDDGGGGGGGGWGGDEW
eukprot:GHVS01025417.1.p1 GENE.GHVS01025417.1~~GHVS01025417.1.p1  ORF type:complete len:281 (+),score=110.83 GHVS01025417.1:227-1069(+)